MDMVSGLGDTHTLLSSGSKNRFSSFETGSRRLKLAHRHLECIALIIMSCLARNTAPFAQTAIFAFSQVVAQPL